MDPRREDIAKLAYQFYLEDGEAAGREEDHWARAEEFLRHPENHSDSNVLAPPSEPELTPALDERALDLDQDLPSNPQTGEEAVHQHMEIATDPGGLKSGTLQQVLRGLKGVTRANASYPEKKVSIGFDSNLVSEKELKAFIASCGFSVA